MVVYVDDIVIVSSSSPAMTRLLQQLSATFHVKDLGSLNYFLNIEVLRNSEGIILTQKKYALDLLQHTNMANCKPVSTPMCTYEKLTWEFGHGLSEDEAFRYRSTIGALQYLTLTRPDLSYAVNKVCVLSHRYSLGSSEENSSVCERDGVNWHKYSALAFNSLECVHGCGLGWLWR